MGCPPPQRGSPRLGTKVGGDPGEGGKIDGAGTQVGADKMALEKAVELVIAPKRQ